MRRISRVFTTLLLIQLCAVAGLTQTDKLAGKWEGKMVSPQGERAMTATFKKEGAGYSGTITGQRGDMAFKEIKLDGDKVTAKAEIDAQGNTLVINYTFTLQGESLKGQGALDFNGTPFTFDIDLKRTQGGASVADAPAQSQQGQGQGGGRQRQDVPQPQQKQSIDYFVGQWSFKYIGRESGLGLAPREGVVTFTKRADGKSVEGVTIGKHDGGSYKESWLITFDEATKAVTFTEKLANGVQLNSKGDWSSPIAIRFTIEPVKTKGQTLQLRRVLSVVAAHSFTVAEELSEDGGPFVRLGNAIYSKVEAK